MKRTTKLLQETLLYTQYASEALESLKRSEPSIRKDLSDGQVALIQAIQKLQTAFEALKATEDKKRTDSYEEK